MRASKLLSCLRDLLETSFFLQENTRLWRHFAGWAILKLVKYEKSTDYRKTSQLEFIIGTVVRRHNGQFLVLGQVQFFRKCLSESENQTVKGEEQRFSLNGDGVNRFVLLRRLSALFLSS
ncbi:hypothetical protein WR25_05455 [Diploscapter pachys]|uniref:Uncharacterized protein n=1 Tax=Diploscapter pachys TaxID=2018661 RepID=A0A2A2KMJ9_9BILA|nr:hypothetical protein WR25_05455 [Diploscapter pachys]